MLRTMLNNYFICTYWRRPLLFLSDFSTRFTFPLNLLFRTVCRIVGHIVQLLTLWIHAGLSVSRFRPLRFLHDASQFLICIALFLLLFFAYSVYLVFYFRSHIVYFKVLTESTRGDVDGLSAVPPDTGSALACSK